MCVTCTPNNGGVYHTIRFITIIGIVISSIVVIVVIVIVTIAIITSSGSILMIEGSLEVKLPTIWTDEKQSREEAERRERLEERRVEEKE